LVLQFLAYGNNVHMIVAGTYPPIHIELGNDEAGMILQREYRESGYRVWRDVMKDGEAVKSPVDIDKLPAGQYRLLD
jgi:hypothetical protein